MSTSSSKEEASAVPPQAKSSWASFLKSMASFNGDLSSMTAPPFILSSTSLTEYSSYWAEHPSVFVAPAAQPTPEMRALAVLKWFLTTLKQQYSSRNEKLGSEKKPLNPFLGELFLGHWKDNAGDTVLISEQVSHHPPVTAYCIWNKEHGVKLQGYNGQKASFSRRIDVKQVGHSLYHLDKHNEDYVITLPSLHIEGLFVGSPFVELNSSTFIQSSTGYTARVDYSGRGWFSGKKNTFTASLYREGREKDPLYVVEGQWSGDFVIRSTKTKATVDSWDHRFQKTTPLTIAPLDEQDELESRRAWRKVAENQQKGDMNAVSHYKTILEESQRELRRKEREQATSWDCVFFTRAHNDDDPLFAKLGGAKLGEAIEADKTGGVWRFDEAKYETAKVPYRAGTVPKTLL